MNFRLRLFFYATIFSVFLLMTCVCFLALRIHLHNAYCIDKTRSVYQSDSRGAYAIINEEACSGFGASDVVSVNLVYRYFKYLKSTETVFKYDPSEFSGPINLRWIKPNVLELSIDRVQFIERQTMGAYGVLIIYRVGAVGNPVIGSTRDGLINPRPATSARD